MADYSVLSNFGVRYFLLTPTAALATGGNALKTDLQLSSGNELTDILSANLGEISKDVKTFKTLNGGGWDSAVPLGQSISEGSMNLIRVGEGNYSSSGTSTYDRLRKWVSDATSTGGATSAMVIVEVVPRGTEANSGGTGTHPIYDATGYLVTPTRFNPGERNTDNGQEFDISFQAYGAPMTSNAYSTLAAGTAFTKSGLEFVCSSAAPASQPS